MIFLEYLDTFIKKINFIETLASEGTHLQAIKKQEALAKVFLSFFDFFFLSSLSSFFAFFFLSFLAFA